MEEGPRDCSRDTELLRLKVLRCAIDGDDVSAAEMGHFVGCLR
jgi:hypothetical protein